MIMNLVQFANEIEKETSKLNKRLLNILESIKGPIPEKPSTGQTCGPGIVGTLSVILQKFILAQEQLDSLEELLLDMNKNTTCAANQVGSPLVYSRN